MMLTEEPKLLVQVQCGLTQRGQVGMQVDCAGGQPDCRQVFGLSYRWVTLGQDAACGEQSQDSVIERRLLPHRFQAGRQEAHLLQRLPVARIA